ncbi:hypothetical protein E6Q11_04280 [Candidatus Dojkabacteria bacterium]|uniref:Uncharacterized protein n=1 Tax=Candidatus Dojkabacteria bacterium TaxID=2099670 RepID=A0A5C7J5B1_9BACT|nr:MAG: hypothetical protein E6Q11_04280 [Candidatus Dojkabacteria bacterium]
MFILKSTHKKIVSSLEKQQTQLQNEISFVKGKANYYRQLWIQSLAQEKINSMNDNDLKQQRRNRDLLRMKKYYQEVLKERTRNGYTRIDSNGIVISNVTNKPVKRYKKHKYVPSI